MAAFYYDFKAVTYKWLFEYTVPGVVVVVRAVLVDAAMVVVGVEESVVIAE